MQEKSIFEFRFPAAVKQEGTKLCKDFEEYNKENRHNIKVQLCNCSPC